MLIAQFGYFLIFYSAFLATNQRITLGEVGDDVRVQTAINEWCIYGHLRLMNVKVFHAIFYRLGERLSRVYTLVSN